MKIIKHQFQASGFQIPFEIWTIYKPISLKPFEIQTGLPDWQDFRCPLYLIFKLLYLGNQLSNCTYSGDLNNGLYRNSDNEHFFAHGMASEQWTKQMLPGI